jgi:hypothetical protein
MLVRWIDPPRTAIAVTLVVALVWAMLNLSLVTDASLTSSLCAYAMLWVIIGMYARCVVSPSASDRRLLS